VLVHQYLPALGAGINTWGRDSDRLGVGEFCWRRVPKKKMKVAAVAGGALALSAIGWREAAAEVRL